MKAIHSDRPARIIPNSNRTSKEEMLPGFFRCEQNQLYACHHQPGVMSDIRGSVLLCNAPGYEYESCHRAMRQLGVQLARSGRYAMRFDYSGTGDSAGEYQQISLVQWRQDIVDAIKESERRSGCEQISLMGMRLGATLAAQVASERNDVDSLVLFAPVFNGISLLSEWKNEHAKYAEKLNLIAGKTNFDEVIGYPMSSEFYAELEKGFKFPEPNRALRRVLIFAEDITEDGVLQISEKLGQKGASVQIEALDNSAIWRREPMEAIVPFNALRRIVTWLDEDQ